MENKLIDKIMEALGCNIKQAQYVADCFTHARFLDASVTIDYKKNYIGVGNDSNNILFYFVNKKGKVMVKFYNIARSENVMSPGAYKLHLQIRSSLGRDAENYIKPRVKDAKTFKVTMGKYDFISLLADGIDPLTGKKAFTPSADLTLALKNIASFILRYDKIDSSMFRVMINPKDIVAQEEKIIAQKRARQVVDENVGSIWTQQEDEQLKKEYLNSMSIDDMMRTHGRTRAAIERRILKIMPMSEIKK